MPPGESWLLTAAMSPRPVVRVAAADAYGQVVNTYTGHRRVTGDEPDRPWAVYLAGPDHRFRLLCFDLDAKTAGTADAAERDAATIAGLLGDVGLSAVVCQSGPGGGRHVWTALAEGVDAATVATLARLTRHLCPTLDLSPLSNPATGCVRPPGAPHRGGGRSTVLAGDLSALTTPSGTAAQVRALVSRLAQLVVDAEPALDVDSRTPLPVDEHARLYLPGPRRELPAVSAAALREDAASGDASAVLWRVLIGAASAHWRHADIAELVDTAPGLEHVRTERDRGQRRPRSRSEAAAVLRRQWDKAVRYVASTARHAGDDPTFDPRAGHIAAHVRGVQARADAAGGRWAHGGGPADRRVLDVLCLLVLEAVSSTVEADTRRVALLAGIGRETARTALRRLSTDGWIAQVEPANGVHAARWALGPQVAVHSPELLTRSQADPRPPGPPPGTGSAERTGLLHALRTRTGQAAHDAFTHGHALGLAAGNLYARSSRDTQPLEHYVRCLGANHARVTQTLAHLEDAGLLIRTGHGWRRPAHDVREQVARRLGVAGRLSKRARRYAIERELWAWWLAEDAWMRAPRRASSQRRPTRGQLSLLPDEGTHAYGPHPRRSDGRLDWRAARSVVEEERCGTARRFGPDRPATLDELRLGA